MLLQTNIVFLNNIMVMMVMVAMFAVMALDLMAILSGW